MDHSCRSLSAAPGPWGCSARSSSEIQIAGTPARGSGFEHLWRKGAKKSRSTSKPHYGTIRARYSDLTPQQTEPNTLQVAMGRRVEPFAGEVDRQRRGKDEKAGKKGQPRFCRQRR